MKILQALSLNYHQISSNTHLISSAGIKSTKDVALLYADKQHTISRLRTDPRCEKTGLRGFRPGPTQTGLYSHRRWLEA